MRHRSLLQRKAALSAQQVELEELRQHLTAYHGLPADIAQARQLCNQAEQEVARLTQEFDQTLGAASSPW